MALNDVKRDKLVKTIRFCKECNKIHENYKYYLEYWEEEKKHFYFECEKLKKIAISAEYHISKFLDLFNFCEKDLEKFTLLLRKTVICFECIDS